MANRTVERVRVSTLPLFHRDGEKEHPMPEGFQPNLSTLDGPQLRLWSALREVSDDFVLYGGTAVAIHLGHRKSVDFDLFSAVEFDPDTLYETLPFLSQSTVLRKSANTLTCLVDFGGPVQVSFFGVPKIRQLVEPLVAPENHLKVASLLDLAGMKAAVVQKRAEAKDYIDIDAILRCGAMDLPAALAAGKLIHGTSFNPEITLKALCFFDDGNLQELPMEIQNRLAEAVRTVDLDKLPDLHFAPGRRQLDQESSS